MVNDKLVGIVALVVIAVVAIFLTVGSETDLFAAKASNNTIDAAVTKDCTITPWVVGQKLGFFKKAGINFVDVGQIAWADQPAALVSGQINVYDGHPDAIIDLLKSGAQIKGVAISDAEPLNNSEDDEHMHWEVKKGSDLNTSTTGGAAIIKARAASGNKVKVGVGSEGICADLEFNAWLRANNMTKNDVQYVVIPDPDQEEALEEGQIDIATLHPPFYKKAETDGNVTVFLTSTQAFGPAAGLTLLTFTDKYIQQYPGTVEDFTNAYKDAERWSNNNRAEAGALTSQAIGLPGDTANVHWYSPSGAIDNTTIGYLQQWINAMVADGDITPGEFTPQDLYTTQFSNTWKTNLPDN